MAQYIRTSFTSCLTIGVALNSEQVVREDSLLRLNAFPFLYLLSDQVNSVGEPNEQPLRLLISFTIVQNAALIAQLLDKTVLPGFCGPEING